MYTLTNTADRDLLVTCTCMQTENASNWETVFWNVIFSTASARWSVTTFSYFNQNQHRQIVCRLRMTITLCRYPSLRINYFRISVSFFQSFVGRLQYQPRSHCFLWWYENRSPSPHQVELMCLLNDHSLIWNVCIFQALKVSDHYPIEVHLYSRSKRRDFFTKPESNLTEIRHSFLGIEITNIREPIAITW